MRMAILNLPIRIVLTSSFSVKVFKKKNIKNKAHIYHYTIEIQYIAILRMGDMSKFAEFEQMGGRDSLVTINKIFYNNVYKHPWLKLYFENIPQQHIEDQQVDFMQKVLGGENLYCGKAPPASHVHIFINDDIFEVRKQLLEEAFIEAKTNPILVEKWLTLDNSFKRVLYKETPAHCKGRFKTDPILAFPNPERK
jgi:truncated hemoglobin YjbI